MPAQIVLTEDVRAILARSIIDESTVMLPEQFDRKTYVAVDKVLKAAGGTWNRGKKAHVFTKDPRVVLGLAIDDGVITDKKIALQQFFTPEWLAETFVLDAQIHEGDRLLEPSAGDGALVKQVIRYVHVPPTVIHCIEIDRDLVNTIHDLGFLCMHGDFLTRQPNKMYDLILMNPPFTRGQDMQHILHAIKFLVPGGRLYAMASAGVQFGTTKLHAQFKETLGGWWQYIEDLPIDAFVESGTNVRAVKVQYIA